MVNAESFSIARGQLGPKCAMCGDPLIFAEALVIDSDYYCQLCYEKITGGKFLWSPRKSLAPDGLICVASCLRVWSIARHQSPILGVPSKLIPSELYLPPRLRSREWMFMGWDDRPPRRHIGYSSAEELHQVLTRSSPPHSCFHSTAYYDRPSEWKMADKGWRGADLIFDLDGDHLPGVDALNFPAMLTTIQEQAYRLWNDFLEPDFGFKEEHATFSFSGHRGFHIHYRHPSILHLDSKARQEIVSHISGANLNIEMAPQGHVSDGASLLVC